MRNPDHGNARTSQVVHVTRADGKAVDVYELKA
jgi:hypothetical protein